MMEGCTTARQATSVSVRAGDVRTVELRPRLCGTLDITVIARRNNQAVNQPIWYSLQLEGGQIPPETLWSPGPKVVSVGKYTLRISVKECTAYDAPVEILAGEPTKVTATLLCSE